MPPLLFNISGQAIPADRTLESTHCKHHCRVSFIFTYLPQKLIQDAGVKKGIKVSSVLINYTLVANALQIAPGCLQGGKWACMMQSRRGRPSSMM